MKLKIAYVLVSSEKDYFLEQTILSAYSAYRYNPEAEIVVVADQDTFQTITGQRARLKKYVSRIIRAEVPETYSMMQKSRYLKTSLLNYIESDFIYLDSDTVVSGSLSDIYMGVNHIGLIMDHNRDEYNESVKMWVRDCCRIVGWSDLSQDKTYNGGLLVVKKSPESDSFFNHWHDNWKECCSKGYDRDQLALTKTNIECKYIIDEISGIYNCQIANFEADKYKSDVRIIHYYDMNNCYYVYNDLKIWNIFKQNDVIPDEFVSAVETPQDVFGHRYIKVYEKEIQFLRSDWNKIYNEYPILRNYLLKVNLAICELWGIARKIKARFK